MKLKMRTLVLGVACAAGSTIAMKNCNNKTNITTNAPVKDTVTVSAPKSLNPLQIKQTHPEFDEIYKKYSRHEDKDLYALLRNDSTPLSWEKSKDFAPHSAKLKTPKYKKRLISYLLHSRTIKLIDRYNKLSSKLGFNVPQFLVRESKKYPEQDFRLPLVAMYQESRCKTDAFNKRSKATGLMQITPRTAQYIAKKYKRSFGQMLNFKKPKDNIQLGFYYFSRLTKILKKEPFQKKDNTIQLVGAAYNGGIGNVKKAKGVPHWLRETVNYSNILEAQINHIKQHPKLYPEIGQTLEPVKKAVAKAVKVALK